MMHLASKSRVAVAGEALIDLFVDNDARNPVAHPGGSPANTAVALARLGTPVSFLGRFSSDAFGALLSGHLAANGVDLRYAVGADEPTSLAVVTASNGDGARYGFHVAGTADWAWSADELLVELPASVRAVHAGSLALALQPAADVLGSWFARQRGQRVTSLDPNIRPSLVGSRTEYVRRLESLVAAADIVKVSDDDLAWAYPEEPALAVAHRWQTALGVALVVVTRGARGAIALHSGDPVQQAAPKYTIVDTVGAGDAFSAGLLHWLSQADVLDHERLRALGAAELSQALEYAAAVAGLTCTKPGADPPSAPAVAAARRHDVARHASR